jgi:AraC-like DNA-binding protein
MDALSEVLTTLHLASSFYCRSELSAPWGLAFPAGNVAMFHAVRRGTCWAIVDGLDAPVGLSAGDLVLFAQGHAHALVDSVTTRARPLQDVLRTEAADKTHPLCYGGGGAPVTLLCGHFSYAHGQVHPLLSLLPPMIHLAGEDGRAAPWLESTLAILAHESASGGLGADAVITRATDILFVQAIRTYLERDASGAKGWLSGLADPQISAALSRVHQSPERPWTVDSLAAAAGMSRSGFSARFHELVGEAPGQYLTRWRMHRAASYLRVENASLAEVATRVGYGAEASFSKAFKRYVGVAPGAFRRTRELA